MKKFYLLLIVLSFTASTFAQVTYNLDVVVYGQPSNSTETRAIGYSIDGEVIDYDGWTAQPSIHIAIIDSSTCLPMSNCNINFGQANIYTDPDGDCVTDVNSTYSNPGRPRAENFFIYRSPDATSIQSMAHLLESVEAGHIIIAYTWFPSTYSSMDTSFSNVFQRLGSSLIPSIQDGVPFIFICKKGDAGSVHEIVGAQSNSLITMNFTYQCSPTNIADMNTGTFTVYPNPVNDKLHIDFKDQQFNDGQIKIYDVLGNLISEIKSSDKDLTIDTKNYSPGFYFIRLESSGHFSTMKFSKIN